MKDGVAKVQAKRLEELRDLLDSYSESERDRMQILADELRSLYMVYHEVSRQIDEQAKSRSLPIEEFVDVGFLFREDANLLDDWRKDATARSELLGKAIAFIQTTKATNDPMSAEDSVRGELATAIIFTKIQPVLPKRGSPEYRLLCKELGVTEEVIDSGLLKLDWKAAGDLSTERVANGKPPLPGLGETYTVVGAMYRRKVRKTNRTKE